MKRKGVHSADQPGNAKAEHRSRFHQPLVQLALIVLVGLGLYFQTLNAPFIFDDYGCLDDNPAIRNFSYFFDFSRVRELNIETDLKNSFALRTLTYLTFALNYAVGGTDVRGYHLVNITIHLAAACLVYFFVLLSLRPLTIAPQHSTKWAGWMPLLTALLFVAHPLQTQAVTYIVQRFTSLVALLYLAVLVLYILARTSGTPLRRQGCYTLALLLALLAMKTKETAFTLPLVLALYEFCFLSGELKKRLLVLLPFFLTMAIIPLTLFWLTSTGGAHGALVDQSLNLVNFGNIGRWEYLITEFSVLVIYLRLLFFPSGQNFDPDYPLAQQFLEIKTFGSFFLLLLLAGTAIFLWRRARRGEGAADHFLRLAAFGIFWFFVTISVESTIIPIDDPLMEYRVYLPSVGIFLAVTAALGWLNERYPAWGHVSLAGILVGASLLGAATLARNRLYLDPLRMYEDVTAKSPAKSRAHEALGIHYLKNEQYDSAIAAFTRAAQLNPTAVKPIVLRGYTLGTIGRFDEALLNFQVALRREPDDYFAHGYLGAALLAKGRFAEAEESLLRSLEISPHFRFGRFWLARLYESTDRKKEAIREYRHLLHYFPDHQRAVERLQALQDGRNFWSDF